MNNIRLDCLSINSVGKVNRLNCSGDMRRRLLDLGIVKDTKITAILRSPSGDPTAFSIRGSTIALRGEDASLIEVCI